MRVAAQEIGRWTSVAATTEGVIAVATALRTRGLGK
jgi:hypothetical protein